MEKTLGGDRLGAGKKMTVELHNYARSTHDLGYLWRSTMSAGTLVPFLVEIALPGDTFDIDLNADIKTHPTIGPLFGSYKVQLDLFQCPIRLYQAQLHNNKLGIGLNMASIKLPQLQMYATREDLEDNEDPDNCQINPSCILSYLGIRGVGKVDQTETATTKGRTFNAVPYLGYWDIYKQYYSNKQEEVGVVVHTPSTVENQNITEMITYPAEDTIPHDSGPTPLKETSVIKITFSGAKTDLGQIVIYTTTLGAITIDTIGYIVDETPTELTVKFRQALRIEFWRYLDEAAMITSQPKLVGFPLSDIDDMRETILSNIKNTAPFLVNLNANQNSPYDLLLNWIHTGEYDRSTYLNTQEGLAIKTYQSDLFNNWLSTEWIDGENGINAITAIDTSEGSFSLDTLNLSKKVYDMLNRIAVSGGSYDDWLDAVYTHDRYQKAESPIYHGGLSKELVFQEVVSNASATEYTGAGVSTESNTQPLGTLAGKGILAKKHKGGKVTVKVDEPSYLIGIVSITPRLDYSQGNKWDIHLKTMDDLHKPALDEIGFQELITEQLAWWDTRWDETTGTWIQKSAGKQPAWINYMTNVNQVRGNFAIENNEMFMTLNRKYGYNGSIKDLTTYIDPVKFNHIFAQTALDAQNFWTQIAVDMTVRRKISAKLMPNL